MIKYCVCLTLLYIVIFTFALPAFSQNPFTSQPKTHHAAPAPPIKSKFFVKLIVWQHQLKQKMSELIREGRSSQSIQPFILLLMVGGAYGAIHAAGPGHGKFVAISYVLSHRASLLTGLLFGNVIAFIHGFSGAMGVLCLKYVLQQSLSKTLGEVTNLTQIVSFALIAFLGLGILLFNGYALFFKPSNHGIGEKTASIKNWLSWALAVGMVPCPAVVMTMLFCLSMDALSLGLLMAMAISLGMAATLSIVIIAVILGKAGAMKKVPGKRKETIEKMLGMVSGGAVMVFGSLFFIAFLS